MTHRICPICNIQFEYFTKGNRKYCDRCRDKAHQDANKLYRQKRKLDPEIHEHDIAVKKAYYDRNREKNKEKHDKKLLSIDLVCPQCGVLFHAKNNLHQKYCSTKCMRRATQDRWDQQCKIDGCLRPVRARGMCSMHWRRWARATGREKNPEWNERRRGNYERRRARKKSNGRVDDFLNVDVYERDRWFCGICGLKVDKELKWPDPMSASLDHIVPLSRGGSHSLDNVQLAHLVCNERKNASVPVSAQGVFDFCA